MLFYSNRYHSKIHLRIMLSAPNQPLLECLIIKRRGKPSLVFSSTAFAN